MHASMCNLARTTEEICQLAQLPERSTTPRYNCIRQPLFPFQPLTHVAPDILHMYLRITDLLFERALERMRCVDGINGRANRRANTSAVVQRFVDFVNRLGVPLRWGKQPNGELFFSSLNAHQRDLILSQTPLTDFIPENENGFEIQCLWRSFNEICKKLNRPPDITKTALFDLGEQCKGWVVRFLETHLARDCTPYMHIFAYHAVESIALHGPMHLQSQQRLEYLNHSTTQIYHRGTNHHKAGKAFVQSINRTNRVTTLSRENVRPKRVYRCTECKSEDHRRTKCPRRYLGFGFCGPENVGHLKSTLLEQGQCEPPGT